MHTQVPAKKVNVLAHSQVLLVKTKLLVQFEHTFADEQVWQLVTLHATQVPAFRVVPNGQVHTPLTIVNVKSLHPHVVSTKLFIQVPQ